MGDAMKEALRSGSVEFILDTMLKPLLDDRSCRVINLPNQLEILLIHDPDTDKSAAAMDVNVGSFSDPDDLPGTAHAVEHFCFMGTKKVSDRYGQIENPIVYPRNKYQQFSAQYPRENEYTTYLSKYGGDSNAYTASISTNLLLRTICEFDL